MSDVSVGKDKSTDAELYYKPYFRIRHHFGVA
jgi:hypothetical protein